MSVLSQNLGLFRDSLVSLVSYARALRKASVPVITRALRSQGAFVFIVFFITYSLGYQYYLFSVGFVSDDLFAFVKVAQGEGLRQALEALTSFLQGRPVGHMLWRVQHTLFLPFHTGWFQLWCGVLVAVQSWLAFEVLRKMGFVKFASIIGAFSIGLAPFYQSVYLPVHAAFTEFATSLFLVGVLLLFARRPATAAFFVALGLTFYEHMLPFVPLAALLPVYLAWRNGEAHRSFRVLINKDTLIFSVVFLVLFVILVTLREGGREQELASLGLLDLVSMGVRVANKGAGASWGALWESWGYANDVLGQIAVLPFLFSVITTASLAYISWPEANGRKPSFLLPLVCILIGAGMVWISYFVMVTRLGSIDQTVGRLSNVHSAARLGYVLVLASVIHIFWVSRSVFLRVIGGVLAGIVFVSLLQFSHAYGAENARVWDRKVVLARAYALACSINPAAPHAIVLLPDDFDESRGDRVLDWTTYMTPPAFFEARLNRHLYVVLHENREAFEELWSQGGAVDMTGMAGRAYGFMERLRSRMVVGPQDAVVIELSSRGALTGWRADRSADPAFCPLPPRDRFGSLSLFDAERGIGGSSP